MKKKNLLYFIVPFMVLCLITGSIRGQSLQRQSISSFGASNQIDGVLIQQTVGQPYATIGHIENEITIRPGFQQYVNFRMEVVKTTDKLIFSLYPNPIVQRVIIEAKQEIEYAFIKITDINGKIMLEEIVNELNKYEIDCNSWPLGIYFIKLNDRNKNVFSTKIIKTK